MVHEAESRDGFGYGHTFCKCSRKDTRFYVRAIHAHTRHRRTCGASAGTILQHDGPNHLGFWRNALPEFQMALITSDCGAMRADLLALGGLRGIQGLSLSRPACLELHRVDHQVADVRPVIEPALAVGEAVILLHPHLPSVGVSIWMERGVSKMTVSPTATPAPDQHLPGGGGRVAGAAEVERRGASPTCKTDQRVTHDGYSHRAMLSILSSLLPALSSLSTLISPFPPSRRGLSFGFGVVWSVCRGLNRSRF